jgi:two-component system sensor histidine kinase CreC
MKLGLRLLFVFFLLNGLAAFFVLRVFVVEIRPSVREVMEDMMVDTANLLAELASARPGRRPPGGRSGRFAPSVQQLRQPAGRCADLGAGQAARWTCASM